MRIDKSELISFKVAVNQAAEMYRLTTSAAALQVIDFIKDNNKEVIER